MKKGTYKTPREGSRGMCACGGGIVVMSGEWVHETDRNGRPLDTYPFTCPPDPDKPRAPVNVARPR